MTAPALERRSPLKQRDRAYLSFTDKLMTRDIKPGQFVSQRELVEITGATLAAIREMVPRLEADGLIRTVPQRGIQIAPVDLDPIRNAFQFRLIIEKAAIAQYAATASDAEITALRAAHADILDAVRGQRPDDALIGRAQAIDWDMHDTFVDSLGNDIVSEAYRVNSIKIRLIRQEHTRLDAERVAPVMEEHLRIVDAIAARDVGGAVGALAAHIEGARRRALGI